MTQEKNSHGMDKKINPVACWPCCFVPCPLARPDDFWHMFLLSFPRLNPNSSYKGYHRRMCVTCLTWHIISLYLI